MFTCTVGLLSGFGTWDGISVHEPHIHDPGIQYEPRSFVHAKTPDGKIKRCNVHKPVAQFKAMAIDFCLRTTMIVGYARVSKVDAQDTRMQEDALRAAGAQRLFAEQASGGRWDRPALHRMLDQLRPDDVVVVWKLDRLSRSLKDLLHIMERIEAAGAGFRSLTEAVDTTTPAGRMLMQMVGSFAEFERAMIRERTQAGLAVARAQGRIGGRRPQLGPQQQAAIVDLVTSGRQTQAAAARLFHVHPATVSRLLAMQQQADTTSLNATCDE